MVKLKFIIRENSLVLRISEGKARYYKSVKHLLKGNPNLQKHWNQVKEKFSPYAINASENNKILEDFKASYQEVISVHKVYTAKEVSMCFDNGNGKVERNFSDCDYIDSFLDVVIAREKEKPGCNFEIYDKLKKKCNRIIPGFKDMTFDFITFDTCIIIAKTFAKYDGYRGTAKAFRALLGRASKDSLVNFSLSNIGDFKFSEYSPNRNVSSSKKPDVMPSSLLRAFVALDLKTCTPKYKNRAEVELYHDFCLFMFNSMFAPCDVVNLQTQHINKNGTITKKREKTHVSVDVPITPAMETIIKKYIKKSKDGYVFPIVGVIKEKHNGARNGSLKKFRKDLNLWLKDVGHEIGAEFELYAYVFRHTAITVALDNGLPVAYVAMVAGTSIEMIQKHYYNGDNQINRSKLQAAFSLASV